MLSARKVVQTLKEYHPPLGGREGLRLDFNENTVGCSPRVLARLGQIATGKVATYPERNPVERTVAAFLGLGAEQVLLTNGVDEAIHLLCETYLEPGDDVLINVPTFSMYEVYAAATGAYVITVPAAAGFAFPTNDMLSRINERTRMISIANPNNPTGQVVSRDDLLAIAERAPNAAVFVDEAYFEFYGSTLMDMVGRIPNLFVARTFSKAYGLAGLRLGVLAGPVGQMRMVRRVSSPYNVNEAALTCLPEALADQEYVSTYVVQVGVGRERLQNIFRDANIEFWPSSANFVLFRPVGDKNAFIAGMHERGILVRDRSRDPGCDGLVRITLGSTEHNEQLFSVLREVLQQTERATA